MRLRTTRCIPLNTVTKEEKHAHALICQVFENCLITQVDLVVAPCNGIPDSLGFWIPRHGFRIPDSGYWYRFSLSVELGFRIPIFTEIPDSLATFQIPNLKIPGSTSKNLPNSAIWIPLHGAIGHICSNSWLDCTLAYKL